MSEARFSGWLVCADCSSLGLDKSVGNGTHPKQGKCNSCGGEWPARTTSSDDQQKGLT